jgi:predicted RNA-binding Zn-ribbon protein involved in translation (DUF1610 family)
MMIETKSYHLECDGCGREYIFDRWNDEWGRHIILRRAHEAGWKMLDPVLKVAACSSGMMPSPDFEGMRFHCPECPLYPCDSEPDRYESLEPFLKNRGEI